MLTFLFMYTVAIAVRSINVMWRYIYKLMDWEYLGRKEQMELEKNRWVKYNLTQEIKSNAAKLKPITQLWQMCIVWQSQIKFGV
jgi:hypothetical protein